MYKIFYNVTNYDGPEEERCIETNLNIYDNHHDFFVFALLEEIAEKEYLDSGIWSPKNRVMIWRDI